MPLDKTYWENKYTENKLGWDIGHASTPLKEYIDQLTNKNLKILVPGAGNGYEVQYLVQQGFRNVYVIDIAKKPLQNIKENIPQFPAHQFLEGDFFDLEHLNFDLILEQSFFCAIDPTLRKNYVEKMYGLLKEGGKLAGLFFDFPLTDQGPPFGGHKKEYDALFREYFKIHTLERAYNSIKPRQGNELFFIFEKK